MQEKTSSIESESNFVILGALVAEEEDQQTCV
jgi:hypothetical protein